MRKTIIILFICIVIICMAAIYGSASTIAPDILALPAFDDLPIRVQDSIIFIQNNEPVQLEVSFSHTEHFYDKTIHVSISTNNPDAAIYYTTDGSEPTNASIQYSEAIEIKAARNVKGTVLKAIAIDDTEQSPVLTHSYFVGTSIDERFSTYVFSISTDADGLYDYEHGIFVPGKTRDDYLEATPKEDLLPIWRQPANYRMRGREWERPVHIEVLTQDGKRIIKQNAGMRVHGGANRIHDQKSLRLIARKEYESGIGRFHYDFFNGYSDINGKPITSHDTLILRNDGNDYGYSRIRTPLASILAKEAGYNVVSPQAPAAVFINGEYYGFAWINIRMNDNFLENLYDAPERSFNFVPINDTNELRTYAENGFNEDDLRSVNNILDVSDLLFYYAIQTYISNDDWPRTNIALWRYTGSADITGMPDELDRRWRHLLWDLDMAMGFGISSAPDTKSTLRLLEDDISSVFQAFMQHDEYIEQYANYICDMISHFSIILVERVIQNLNDATLQELKISLELYESSFNRLLRSREDIIDFFKQRPDYVLDELRELFGFTQMYKIQSDGSVKINTLNNNAGYYFIENRVPVYPKLEKGYVFDYWLVNGEKRYEEDLLISFSDANLDGIVHVGLISREELPPLFFKDIFDTGDLFGFTMYNPTDSTQNTQGLFLSNDINNLHRWQFPNMNVRSERSLEFVGRNSTSQDSLLKIGLNFNPRQNDIIYLSNKDGEILDSILFNRE
ncbi:MAG: CotH kinase family protein [Oscillospiraceae bacterium]|jgi:hypothetical protein|nr:CotH kinase family protein [Oscillospiraceae bacterium]